MLRKTHVAGNNNKKGYKMSFPYFIPFGFRTRTSIYSEWEYVFFG